MKTIKLLKSPDVGMSGNDLRRLRQDAGMSRNALQELLGWNTRNLEDYGRGIFYIHKNIMDELLGHLGVEGHL